MMTMLTITIDIIIIINSRGLKKQVKMKIFFLFTLALMYLEIPSVNGGHDHSIEELIELVEQMENRMKIFEDLLEKSQKSNERIKPLIEFILKRRYPSGRMSFT